MANTASDKQIDLEDFLPYLLNRAAEKSSMGFQQIYKTSYGMTRMEWRVLFHLGRYGQMTAKDICTLGDLHKTKVSRAVAALEAKQFLHRIPDEDDRRFEQLSLSRGGTDAYEKLRQEAGQFNAKLSSQFSAKDHDSLIKILRKISSYSLA